MRVLLVTLSDMLPFALTQVLNPELEYCAIVVDEPDISKKMLENYPPFRDKIFPFYELKECVENFYYDLLIGVYDFRLREHLPNQLNNYGIEKNKFVAILLENSLENSFLMDRSLRYYKEHAEEFEMFATGISYVAHGLDARCFKRKLFNFGRAAQDLYYNFQIAKYVLEVCGGGYIKYALIGLAPYSFYYDQSLSSNETWRLLQYHISFKDLHNFWLTADEYHNLFMANFLNQKLSLENFDTNNVYMEKRFVNPINCNARIGARGGTGTWNSKDYFKTRNENIKILDEYLSLCESNQVRPIMFLPPMTEGYKKYFNRKKLDEFYYLVREAQKKHPSAVFLDGWKLEEFSDIDFADVDHLNLQGAVKFSAILNNVIESLEKG